MAADAFDVVLAGVVLGEGLHQPTDLSVNFGAWEWGCPAAMLSLSEHRRLPGVWFHKCNAADAELVAFKTRVRPDRFGRFMARLPALEHMSVAMFAEGYAHYHRLLPGRLPNKLEIRLARSASIASLVELRPADGPADTLAFARVSMAARLDPTWPQLPIARTDAWGRLDMADYDRAIAYDIQVCPKDVPSQTYGYRGQIGDNVRLDLRFRGIMEDRGATWQTK